jgi:23S rRNA (uracil1939-C5)-methyltransferase
LTGVEKMSPTFEIELTGYSFGGDSIGRLPDGKAVFVPFGIQGERVTIEIVEEKRNFARGRITKVMSPNAKRIIPRCPHFQECGGCHYQHLPYSEQLIIKQNIVIDQLQRLGRITNPPVLPIVPSPNEWNYRNTMQFHMSMNGKPGFQRVGGHGIVEIRECHLPLDSINKIWPGLDIDPASGIERVSVRRGSDGEHMLGLESQLPDAPEFEVDFPVSAVFLGSSGEILLSGDDHSIMQVNGRDFRVSAGAFFQVNLPQAEAMVKHILEVVGDKHYEIAIDAYCGVGLFSAFLAPKTKNLVGIEMSEPACNDYSFNLDEFDNVSLYVGAVEDVQPALDVKPNLVILDPPRSGLEQRALEGLIHSDPDQIIYVSCDPATLARDTQKLAAAGYTLRQVTPFDLFPQTYHIETVSVFDLHPLSN